MGMKLFVSDLDGCLLRSDGSLPSGFGSVMEKLAERGAVFAAASGRSPATILRMFAPWAGRMGFVTDNGARVFLGGKTVLERALSPEDMLPVLEEARRHGNVIALACGADSEWIERPERVTPELERELSKYYPGRKMCDLARVPDRIVKLALLYTGDIERDVYPAFRRFDAGRLHVQVTSFHWIDAYARDASKGTGVEALQKELGIAPEETAVFGDYLNDVPMAAYAARSFAPANAHPAVLEAFTDVIGRNDEESVPKAILDLL